MMGRSLGELEHLLLLGLLRAGGDAAGIELRNELERRTGRSVLPGAVYTIMERLRERGFVSTYTGDATPERGGRRRKHYRILPAGEAALARAYGQVAAMADGVEERLRALLEES
jgi:PadR family transcriptional regulator PadR